MVTPYKSQRICDKGHEIWGQGYKNEYDKDDWFYRKRWR